MDQFLADNVGIVATCAEMLPKFPTKGSNGEIDVSCKKLRVNRIKNYTTPGPKILPFFVKKIQI